MDKFANFANSIKDIMLATPTLDINSAREIIRIINDFLYTSYDGIGSVEALDQTFQYFSDFHKFWHTHYSEILNCQIDKSACEKVAEKLHYIYKLTDGKVFKDVWDTCGLNNDEVCRVRLLTANQDFRGSLKFSDLANVYNEDNAIFDVNEISRDPDEFIKSIKVTDKSQTDKRKSYAKNIADFLLSYGIIEPSQIISCFGNDVSKFRDALINLPSAGYGNKKTDMLIRDMVVLGVWQNVKGFDIIDVASDINTMKVALRTGIITTSIPLVTSFLDIFCYQYGYLDQMNALAWRTVWEKWQLMFPNETIESPCLLDYFIYNVIGKQFCKDFSLFQCETDPVHVFPWHSGNNRTCQICYKEHNTRNKAHIIGRIMPCCHSMEELALSQTKFIKEQTPTSKLKECPFTTICGEHKRLQAPKSISILGQTGWSTAYSIRGEGGGGLMA